VPKPLKLLAMLGCLALAVLGGLLPGVGWLLLLLAFHILVSEFETGRDWVKGARRRWPILSRFIVQARGHPWAPQRLHRFDDLTNPAK
jgi:hypothetical protein